MNRTKKINVDQVCEAYNKARVQNMGKKGNSEYIINILKSFGVSGAIAKRMIGESALFQQFHRENAGRGNHKGYIFPQTPVHVSWFQNWIYGKKEETPKISIKKDENFEAECASYLKQQGYQLKKCIGFDEEAFKKDYPQLYTKYLIYENI
jgi:hypothetical protein